MSSVTPFRGDIYDGGEGGFGNRTALNSSPVTPFEEKRRHSTIIANCVISAAAGVSSTYGILRVIDNEMGNTALFNTSNLVEALFLKIIPALLMGVGITGFMLVFSGCGDRKLTETETKVGALGLGMMLKGYLLAPAVFMTAAVVKLTFSNA